MKIVHLICGARPNFMKVAPLYHALADTGWCTPVVIHTGQHSDSTMSDVFLKQFNVPVAHNLAVRGATSTETVALTMVAYEEQCKLGRPHAIVVVGDVDATAACALVGAKLGIPVVHLEAGLRSYDRSMPEEINRIVTDAISNLLLTPNREASQNLLDEGISRSRVHTVGNIMIDALEMMRPQIEAVGQPILGPYALVTLHRPSNVDVHARFAELLDAIVELSQTLLVAWPMHPRTYKRLVEFNERGPLDFAKNLYLYPPQGYVKFMALMKNASIVITDSGGVQEETTYLGVPCLTLRANTERPVTLSHGTNELVSPENLVAVARDTLRRKEERPVIPLWDGHTAERVLVVLKQFLEAA